LQNSTLGSSYVVVAPIENYNTTKPLNVSPEKSQILSCDTVVANERYVTCEDVDCFGWLRTGCNGGLLGTPKQRSPLCTRLGKSSAVETLLLVKKGSASLCHVIQFWTIYHTVASHKINTENGGFFSYLRKSDVESRWTN
jgi:hypothetical protein